MKPLGLRQDQQLLVGVVVFAAAGLWGYGVYLMKPLAQAVSRVGQDARTASITLQHVEQTLAQEPQLRNEFRALSETTATLRASLPSEEELPSSIELLSDLANQTGVKIQTIFPQRSLDRSVAPNLAPASTLGQAGLYKEIPIQIDALAGFHQLGSFLSRVESGSQSIQLSSLRISGNPKEPRRHHVRLVLLVYFAAVPEAKPTASSRAPATRGGT